MPLNSANTSAITPAMTASARLAVTTNASPPTPAPVASAPSLRPKMPRAKALIIGMATNSRMASSNRPSPRSPWPLRPCGCVTGGSASPRTSAPMRSTPAFNPPA